MLGDTWASEFLIKAVELAYKCDLADKQSADFALHNVQSRMFQQLMRTDVGNNAQREKFYNFITTGAQQAIIDGKRSLTMAHAGLWILPNAEGSVPSLGRWRRGRSLGAIL